jgi:glycosidase
MTDWPTRPFIYEINASVWLTTLGERYDREVTLTDVPDEVLDELTRMNVDTIWLMGVWQRSAAGRESALNYVQEYKQALPDLVEADVVGSAYAVGAYAVDSRLGGRAGLISIRSRLQERGLKLILDYVPNHIATDHPWVTQKPQVMLCGTDESLEEFPDLFFAVDNGREKSDEALVVAHGRDPSFPGWIDTAQVNAFSVEFREESVKTLLDIAAQCDGVRCDMAMLMINDVFAQTWKEHLNGQQPLAAEFWEEVIAAVKEQYPNFKFIAEVYWNMESTLLKQGFDMTYDKQLYDYVQGGNIKGIRSHLQAKNSFQKCQVHFIENHDEGRAAASLGIEKSRAAATLICTIPGTVLLHNGQLTGRRIKLPVQINRQPDESVNHALAGFYHRLLSETRAAIYQSGRWQLFDIRPAYTEDTTHENLLAYGWSGDGQFRVIVVNLTGTWSQGIVEMNDWQRMRGKGWRLFDVLGGFYTYRDGDRMVDEGLYIEFEPYQSKIFRFELMRSGL